NPRVDPPHRAPRGRPRPHPAVHRARHGGGVLHRPPDHRAPPGAGDRGRRPRRRAPRSRGEARLSGRDPVTGGAGSEGAAGTILAVEDVYTAYGLSQVLFGVSLEVRRGECVCLLGRNGVGKTTTMRSIIGLTAPSRGRVTWKGADVTGRAPYQI